MDFKEGEPLLVDVPRGVPVESTMVFTYRSGMSPKEQQEIEEFFVKFPRWKKVKQGTGGAGEPLIQMTLFFCPKCGSIDVQTDGSLSNAGGSMGPNMEYQAPTFPNYECNKCGELFNV